jgi:hypothetical protein
MKTNIKSHAPNQNHLELSDEELVELNEMCGLPVPSQSNLEWIHLLRERLLRQKRQFASLLDHAAENPGLLERYAEFRREIQATRQRLADCRALRSRLN